MIRDHINFAEACAIATRGMLDNASAGDLACAEYADFADRDFMEYDPRKSGALDPEFIEFVTRRAADLVCQDVDLIEDLVDGEGFITVFRAMTVPPKWLRIEHEGIGLGVYWAWSEDCAISHHGSGGPDLIEVRLRGRVHVDDVDWTMTIGLNACDDYAVGTENEIRISRNAVVELDRIEWRQDIFDDFVEYALKRAFGMAL